MVSIWFPGAWPTFNEYIAAERGSSYSKRRFVPIGANMKREWTAAAQMIAQAAGVDAVHVPCGVKFVWHTKNAMKDPDGIAAFATKCILDGLQGAGVLPNDGQRQIWRIVHEFVRDANEGVMVTLGGEG